MLGCLTSPGVGSVVRALSPPRGQVEYERDPGLNRTEKKIETAGYSAVCRISTAPQPMKSRLLQHSSAHFRHLQRYNAGDSSTTLIAARPWTKNQRLGGKCQ